MAVSLSQSPRIAQPTPASGVVLPELQRASAALAEQQAYAEREAPLASAAATVREEPRARAAEVTRMAADPSCPAKAEWKAIGRANLIPGTGFLGDYRRLAAVSARSEQGLR